jgi:hypothetical protein
LIGSFYRLLPQQLPQVRFIGILFLSVHPFLFSILPSSSFPFMTSFSFCICILRSASAANFALSAFSAYFFFPVTPAVFLIPLPLLLLASSLYLFEYTNCSLLLM